MKLPIAAATLLAFCFASATLSAEEKERPNIVFILADDLGINDLHCYGRQDQATPHLDRLAAQGLRFTSSYCAQPICSPSRAAILTGKAPARLHLTTFLPGRANTPAQKLLHPNIAMQLPLEEQTIADYLRDAGYATACVGKWHLGGKGFGPAEQGFEYVHAGRANTVPSATEGGKGEYDLTAHAIEFIEKSHDRPFFLYLAHNNPHIPLAAKPELVEKYPDSFNPLYAAVIDTLDDSIGLVLAKLDELKLADNTIVVFTSDNGGLHVLEFTETPATHNTPYRAGKGFVYEGGTRIPTIVRWPGHIAAGKTSDTPFMNSDWLPTLLELCNVPVTKPVDGQSIAPLLAGKSLPERTFFWHFPHYTNQGSRPAGAVRAGDWKLVEHYDTQDVELYNLADDIGETKNLAAQHPERVKNLRGQLAHWRDEVGAQGNEPNPDFRPELFQRLYVDTDVSKLQPAPTAAEMRPALQPWRQLMNEVLPKRKEPPGSSRRK
jgi:arylsulfatase A-like enzyme